MNNSRLLLATVLLLIYSGSQASTVTTFDVVVTTDNLTVIGTTTIQGNAFSVGGSTLTVVQGNVGIGTTTPRGQIHAISGASQFLWLPSSAAIRVGIAGGTQWDPLNIGVYSIAFGQNNKANGANSAVLGGKSNIAAGSNSAIPGGVSNEADAGAQEAIVSGSGNTASNILATISGGSNNLASGLAASISGGSNHIASGQYAMIPGGNANTASGIGSFAGGIQANATHHGSFVWAAGENSGSDIAIYSAAKKEFRIGAAGGFAFVSGSTSPAIIVSSGAIIISTSPTAATAVPNIYISTTAGNVGIGKINPATTLDVNGAITASSATFTATGSNIYSLTSSSGIHILAGGITWPDGTTSTTATSGGGSSGDASLSSTQTFSGANTFTGTTTFGGSSQAPEQAMPSVLARSFSGVADSSGCVVVIAMGSVGGTTNLSTSRLVFTSTTSVLEVGMLGVLQEPCNPGQDCRIQIAGPTRAQARPACTAGQYGTGVPLSTWSTRCQSNCGAGTPDGGHNGITLSNDWSSGWAWFWLR